MKYGIWILGVTVGTLVTSASAQDDSGWTPQDEQASQAAPSNPPPPSVPPAPQSAPVYVEQIEESPPANTLTWAPLDLVVGTIRFEYEHALAPFLALHVTAGALLFDGVGVDIPDDYSFYAITGGLGARFFMTGHAPEGFWVGPRAQLAYARVENDGASGSGIGYSAGGEIGYTFLFGDAFVLSAGGGVAYIDIDAEATSSSGSTAKAGTSGVTPTLRLNLGFAF